MTSEMIEVQEKQTELELVTTRKLLMQKNEDELNGINYSIT